MQTSIQFVSATKLPYAEFVRDSALGRSFARVADVDDRVSLRLSHSNATGLSTLYNRAIDAAEEADILVFLHDDVWIEDYFIADRVIAGLAQFDVIGLAGSAFLPEKSLRWGVDDRRSARGWVGHGRQSLGRVVRFGPSTGSVDVLDGLFLAVRRDTLRKSGVRFDEAFSFHFYDLDFCTTARRAGLRLGVWPIAVTHQSRGDFEGPQWQSASEIFAKKWRQVTQDG